MMRIIAPTALLILGILVMLGAFLYYATNALPYQDPTAELLAYQAAQARKCMLIASGGFLAALCSAVLIRHRLRSGTDARNPQGRKAHS